MARAVAGREEAEGLPLALRQDGYVEWEAPLCTLIETFTNRIISLRFVLLCQTCRQYRRAMTIRHRAKEPLLPKTFGEVIIWDQSPKTSQGSPGEQ